MTDQTVEPNIIETLSYCNTCQIVRPPRSFHCTDCGFCIEVHDHHCPWMGTCIGVRNIRYFVCFLFYTSLHSLLTSLIAALFLIFNSIDALRDLFGGQNEPNEFMKVIHILNICVGIYSSAFFLMLSCFAASMHCQVQDNVTTNEQIRKKWNAKNREGNRARPIKCWDKFKYIYFGDLPVSRIQRYYELRQ